MKEQMPERLLKLIDEIWDSYYEDEKWLELEKEANEYLKTLNDEQREFYRQNGAGEVLYMICSGIRYRRGDRTSDINEVI